ncbi:hypothetical protein C9374_011754 [Naegleria lovaniensis]|uniref:Uncharacterized protein n=1 Tax=Naegleria lovaniensis TaxID=51637 RepID=A0AA88GEE6_NAELO|nr:uncharacterized protein C9374_011754 [Naegleria lovaniensis]KAG2373869.1 hypothetical protein C9374_011754 [Naegleria lovaniensis]
MSFSKMMNPYHLTTFNFAHVQCALENPILVPFLMSKGLDQLIFNHSLLYHRMVVDVKPWTGFHQKRTMKELIENEIREKGIWHLLKGGTASQARMFSSLMSLLLGLVTFPVSHLAIYPLFERAVTYPLETLCLSHLRRKASRSLVAKIKKLPKLLGIYQTSEKPLPIKDQLMQIVNNLSRKVEKTVNELDELRNRYGVLNGWYRGFFDAYLVEFLASWACKIGISWCVNNVWSGIFGKNSQLGKEVLIISLTHTLVTPIRFARMRYQSDVHHEYPSFWQCLQMIYRLEGGWKAFYRGTVLGDVLVEIGK